MPSVSPVAQIATWTDIVRRASDAWRDASKGHDKGKLAQLYTGDACIKVPGHPDACGRIGVEKAAEAFWSEFPDARTAWSRAWLLGDVLAVESAWMGTNNRADGRNTKKPTYRTAGGSVVTLSWLAPDGQIREQHVYGDEGLVASELGSSGKAFEGLPTTRERHEARGTPAEDANVERVRATFASPPELAAFARDAELADPTRASPLPARSGAGRWVAARASGLTSARVTPTHLWGAEDAVLCEYEATGIRKEGGGAPRGPVTVHGVELFRVEAGQLTLAVRYRDSLELSPPPGPPPSLPSMAP
jgi:ketosteroid isomerase-like protein